MIAAITGHRPEKIHDWQFVDSSLSHVFYDLKIDKIIQGCAPGVDLHSARVAYHNNIPYVCARPWKTHQPRAEDKIMYEQAILHAVEVVDVSEISYYPGSWVYQKRNEWMVNKGDMLVAVWDGTNSGTGHTVRYAKSLNKKIYRIDPNSQRVGWYR